MLGVKTKIVRKYKKTRKVNRLWKERYQPVINAPKKVILVNTPEHDNLGDHALALAEYELLRDTLPGHEIIEIPAYVIRNFSDTQLKRIVGDSLLLIHAGGYIGTIWIQEEENVRKMLSLFPNNPSIILPQTITFSNDAYGQEQKAITKSVYQKCKNLQLFVREEKSIPIGKELLDEAQVHLVPDMVVGYSPKYETDSTTKSGCLLCMRRDREKALSEQDLDILKSTILEAYPDTSFSYTDTVLEYNIGISRRFSEVEKKIKQFSNAELIVTDRLHGMVFAAIAGTPCLILNNANGKVQGVYQWIKDLNYLAFINDMSECKAALDLLKKAKTSAHSMESYRTYYKPLTDAIRSNAK